MRKTTAMVLSLSFLTLSNFTYAADDKVKEVDFVTLCKKECPGTNKNKDVFECAEAKEKDPEFKKTKCAIEYAKYEAAHGGHHDNHDGHAH